MTTNRAMKVAGQRRADRGATFILVLAVLSILVFVAAAFTYTSRLEAIASNNFSQTTQARMAASAGLPAALPYVRSAMFATSRLQPWARIQNEHSQQKQDEPAQEPPATATKLTRTVS